MSIKEEMKDALLLTSGEMTEWGYQLWNNFIYGAYAESDHTVSLKMRDASKKDQRTFVVSKYTLLLALEFEGTWKMKPNELQIGIKNLRDFLKKVAKKMPDKNNRGFVDHMDYLADVLDGMEGILNYVDNPHLDFLQKLEQKYEGDHK